MKYRIIFGAALLAVAAACGKPASETPLDAVDGTVEQREVVIYSGRGEDLIGPLFKKFEEQSGIKVRIKYGGTPSLAGTIREEGAATPADVFIAQDPGGLGAVASEFAVLPDTILQKVPEWARSDQGKWVGLSGRARTVVYNTDQVTKEELPDDLWGFTDPKWKGKIGWAPSNSSFQTMVTALRHEWGEDRTKEWLKKIKANNPREYPKNTPIVNAAGQGEIAVGFVNHYYLHRFLASEGESFPARNYHLRAGGAGNLIMVSGAGILQASENKGPAQELLLFLLSKEAQEFFVQETFEYPLVEGITPGGHFEALEEIEHPTIDPSQLQGLEETQQLLREAGILT